MGLRTTLSELAQGCPAMNRAAEWWAKCRVSAYEAGLGRKGRQVEQDEGEAGEGGA